MRVPGQAILSMRVAIMSEELQVLYRKFPLYFSPRCSEWQNYVLAAFILREKQKHRKGEGSAWGAYIDTWPRQFDILEVWEEEELDELQDPSLLNKAMEEYTRMTEAWSNFYAAACHFPSLYEEGTITLSQFQWAWNIQSTRCFGSSLDMSMLVPFADLINHENTAI